jgi:hypothetical protein
MNAITPPLLKTYDVRPLYRMDGTTPWGYGVYETHRDDTIGRRLCDAATQQDAERIRDALKDSDTLDALIQKGMVF